jgi:diacylglycerol kinase (ATP)
MNHLFVINPVAGDNDATPSIIAQLEEIFGEDHEHCEIHITKGPGECTGFLRNHLAANRTPTRVYACGGDGTLNETLNGVIGFPHVSLACYPCGTANDFIKIFGRESAFAFRDIRALVNGGHERIDLIRCMTNDSHDGRYAINICSAGLDARVARDVHRYSDLPLIGGTGAYIFSLILNVIKGISQKYTITIEGKDITSDYAILVAANGRYYGGSFCAVPEAMPNDGLCDFLVVPKLGRIALARMIGRFKNGRHREIPQYIKWQRGESLRIRAKKPFAANVDGEAWLCDDITFSIVRDGLSFVVPNGVSWNINEQNK